MYQSSGTCKMIRYIYYNLIWIQKFLLQVKLASEDGTKALSYQLRKYVMSALKDEVDANEQYLTGHDYKRISYLQFHCL